MYALRYSESSHLARRRARGFSILFRGVATFAAAKAWLGTLEKEATVALGLSAFADGVVVLRNVLAAAFGPAEGSHETMMLEVDMSEESPLRAVFIFEAYHINVIAQWTGMWAIPLRQRLGCELIHCTIQIGSSRC